MIANDAIQSAKAAGLHYISSGAPGILRRPARNGFEYRLANGRVVKDAATLARIRSLVLPPAWTDVWIAADPIAHLQAIGRDAAGRKQYRYHASWRTVRDTNKYHRMLQFARALPAIRRRVALDMRARPLSREHVLATVVRLLERTHIRIGNEEYARANGSHGLTTLRNRHVAVRGRHLHFDFKAKSGVHQSIDIEDAVLARAVRRCQELPGQTLFQYRDDSGAVKTVTSADVNSYLHAIAGDEFTAKDFRTWAGTVAAAEWLAGQPPPASRTAGARVIVAAIDHVAKQLGNTRAVCRKCYIHPAVLEAFSDGDAPAAAGARARSPRGLLAAEARLVALLKRRDGKPMPILGKGRVATRGRAA